jgi:hypothetical protein
MAVSEARKGTRVEAVEEQGATDGEVPFETKCGRIPSEMRDPSSRIRIG